MGLELGWSGAGWIACYIAKSVAAKGHVGVEEVHTCGAADAGLLYICSLLDVSNTARCERFVHLQTNKCYLLVVVEQDKRAEAACSKAVGTPELPLSLPLVYMPCSTL